MVDQYHQYTVLMRTWDLNKDIHSHIRRYLNEYLDVFENKRGISKDLKEFVIKACIEHDFHRRGGPSIKINPLRLILLYRVRVIRFMEDSRFFVHHRGEQSCRFESYLIEHIHPPKYYHEGVKKSDIVKGA